MAYSHKTFRKCGSHYSELGAIEGVEVKVGEKFRPPKKITLPVGFHPKDPSDVLSLTYDFTLENKIIEKAEKEKARQLQEEEEKKAAAALATQHETSNTDTAVSQTVPISVFSNVGTDILQPIAVTATGHKRNDSLGKNTFDLSDFEANGTNPFELVELQTINDLDVLKSVLQPVTQLSSTDTTTGSTGVASAGISTNVTPTSAMGSVARPSQPSQPFSYLSNQPPIPSTSQADNSRINSILPKSVPDHSDNQLVDIPTDKDHTQLLPNVTSNSRSVSPPSSQCQPSQPNSSMSMGYGIPTQPFSYLQGPVSCLPSTLPPSNPVFVNINSPSPTPASQTPISATSSSINTTPTVYPTVGQNVQLPMNSRNNRLPPLRKPPPIPPRPQSRNINSVENINSFQGTTVSDGVVSLERSSEPLPLAVTSSQDTTRIPGNYMIHNSEANTSTSTNQSVIRRQPAQRRTNTSTEKMKHRSTPLPAITSPIPYVTPPIPLVTPPIPTPRSSQSVLPDPLPVLTESEKKLVKYIAAMGFPAPRVARAVQRLGEKDREVVDFLVAIEDLCQSGFSGDEAEIAMTLNKYDSKKAIEFLNLTKTFKELGFEESHIQEALRAADNDSDKALDFLASIAAS